MCLREVNPSLLNSKRVEYDKPFHSQALNSLQYSCITHEITCYIPRFMPVSSTVIPSTLFLLVFAVHS